MRLPGRRPGYRLPHTGSIYGLSLLANRPIPGVDAAAIPSVDIQLVFGQLPDWFGAVESSCADLWYATDYKDQSGNPALQVFRLLDGQYYWFRYADKTEFLINREATNIWAVWPDTLTLEDTATYLLGPIMGFVLLLRGYVSLHASAIVIDDQAVALVGPAGAGKSTTAAAFAELGHGILAEDVVTLDDRGAGFLVQPAYPCIRLWPASVNALFGQHIDLPRLTPTWDKRYLDLTHERYQFHKEPLPLAAIYVLEPRSEDGLAPFVQHVPEQQTLMSLVANTYSTRLMNPVMRAREFEVLGRLVKTVPVRQIIPHASPSRIPELCQRITEDFAGLKSRRREPTQPEQLLNV